MKPHDLDYCGRMAVNGATSYCLLAGLMNMEIPPFYDEVHDLALRLVNSQDETKSYWQLYEKLRMLCENHADSEKDHPFQWETLADFTLDDVAALEIYAKALGIADILGLEQYSASIQLAMAERYLRLGELENAFNFASCANEIAKITNDLELRKEISEFLMEICGNKSLS
ncbi:tetratricopeptide repeat protein [Shewanella mangrovisoli]|uniref:tetratricopeptide repeat protein n=1 Tax=Shewanella mangrovisoli TaxID=2864211 RepID=UPI0035B9F4DF